MHQKFEFLPNCVLSVAVRLARIDLVADVAFSHIVMLVAHSIPNWTITLDCQLRCPLPQRWPSSQGRKVTIYVFPDPSASLLPSEGLAKAEGGMQPVVMLYQGSLDDFDGHYVRAFHLTEVAGVRVASTPGLRAQLPQECTTQSAVHW